MNVDRQIVSVYVMTLQVNRSPSFGTDEQLDYDIKSAVIEDAVRMLNIKCASGFFCNCC